MSSEVGSIRLRDLSLRVTKGTTPTKGEGFVACGVNYIKSESITADGSIDASKFAFIDSETHDKLARSKLRAGNVLFSMAGVYLGKTAVVLPEHLPANTNQAVGIITLDESKADPCFIHYSLQSPACRAWVLRSAAQSAQPNFNLQEIGDLRIPAFPLVRQKEIAGVLRTLDDRITLLRETNATLEAIAQALFKSWFVDFDPVHAKQQGRAPEGMDEATAALFPDALEETELGPVPRGWKTGTLGDVAQTARRQLQVSDLNADLNYVGLEHVPRKSLSLTEWGNAEGLESAKAAFAEGDILFGRLRPYFHKVVVAPFSGVCSTDILVCQPIRPEYSGVVTMHLFSEALIQYADRLSNGAKMPRVSWKDLAVYPISVPPPQVAEAYNKSLQSLMDRMKANIHQAQTLATLRDTLLPRLISGQLSISDTGLQIEEAIV